MHSGALRASLETRRRPRAHPPLAPSDRRSARATPRAVPTTHRPPSRRNTMRGSRRCQASRRLAPFVSADFHPPYSTQDHSLRVTSLTCGRGVQPLSTKSRFCGFSTRCDFCARDTWILVLLAAPSNCQPPVSAVRGWRAPSSPAGGPARARATTWGGLRCARQLLCARRRHSQAPRLLSRDGICPFCP